MTKEERIDWLCRLRADLNNGIIYTPWNKEFTEALTKVLEQQPCEDYVKREDVKSEMIKYGFLAPDMTVTEFVEDLPSVTPQPCEDAISRQMAIDAVTKIHPVDTEYDCTLYDKLDVMYVLKDLPSVTPSHEDLKEAYINGYDYGVKDWFKAKTDKPDIKAEIIKRIEQVRDNDKNAGEYPYNRCIEIIREVMG